MSDRPDPAAALLAALSAAHAEAEAKDPAAAAWLGDVVAVAEKAIPLIQAHALREMSSRLADNAAALPWADAGQAGRSIRAGLKESAYLLNLRADEIEASRG